MERFRLPPGFRIELVASEPDISKPINLNFDCQGGLLVSQSVEYPFPASPNSPGRDAIKRLVDSDGDGIPEKVTTFADGLNIPIGVTPVPGGVLGFSIPNLSVFGDADGDGHAEQRRVVISGFGYGDTHGMVNGLTWWIDGWVYGCHGFANSSTVHGTDRRPITVVSGNTYRLQPDGSHIEHFTFGQVNPFGMTFDPLGNLYTADCHTKPIYMLLRGATYPSFGKSPQGLGFGPAMMQHNHGSTGIAGIVYYAADRFPEEYRGTIFVGNPVTGRVNHDRLETFGSTRKAIELPDFLSCEDPWFRPVDLQLAPDGSLYIADFYNRIIGHYEVPLNHPKRDRKRGRIWRVSHVEKGENSAGLRAPNLPEASIDRLIVLLGDPNLVVRTQATHQLVHRIGQPATEAVSRMLIGPSGAYQRAHGLWVLLRLESIDTLQLSRLASDSDRLVRVHALKALTELQRWGPSERRLALEKLNDEDAFVRRAAAEALGVHPHAENIGPLLELWKRTPRQDTHLVHATRIALRNSVQSIEDLSKLAERYRAEPGDLRLFVEIMLGIGLPQAASFLLEHYQRNEMEPELIGRVVRHIGRYLPRESLPTLHEFVERFEQEDLLVQLEIIRALHQSMLERGEVLPDHPNRWAARLSNQLLESKRSKETKLGIELASELKLSQLTPLLVRLASPDSPRKGFRYQALGALIAVDREQALIQLHRVLSSMTEHENLHRLAAELLGRLNTTESRRVLLDRLRIAPERLTISIARGLSKSPEGGEDLLRAVEKGEASVRILQDAGVSRLLHALGIENLSSRLAKQLEGLPPQDERVLGLISKLYVSFENATPDLIRGAEIFSKRCAVCHRIAGKGSKVGPDLDGIGARGPGRLLEDVLAPNRNVDVNFRSSMIVMSDGRLLAGLVLREEGQVLVIVDEAGKEQRVRLAEIEQRRRLRLSPMPANIDEELSEEEIQHLIGYLLGQRP